MTTILHSYPVYKPSGVPWIGNAPEHWDVPRLKGYVTNAMELTRTPLDGELYLALEHVESWTGRFSEAGDGTSFSGQVKRFHAEDVLFGKLRPYLAKVTCPKRNGMCVGEFLVLRPHDGRLSPHYLEQLLRSKPAIDGIDSSTFGAKMPRADWQFIGDLLFPLPPLPEQHAIVRYLDHADRRIRRYISAKRKLIVLLEEEKQAVINQAVTRGLDPNVRFKPSGVEWLGDVPEHWEIPRLRNLGDALIGLTYDPQYVVDEEAGILVLRASNILDGKLVYGDNVFVRSAVPDKLVTREGDILICSRSGSRALIGKNARINAESAGTTFGAFMTVFRGANNDYLHLVFNSKFFEYQSAAFFTSTINQLTLGILYGMKVPFPPLEERQLILRYVEETTAPIIKAIAHTRRQIELVQEYRTRLIADVVTGKLDVREAAALLLDEADDEEPMDEGGPLVDGMNEDPYDADNFKEGLTIEEEVTV